MSSISPSLSVSQKIHSPFLRFLPTQKGALISLQSQIMWIRKMQGLNSFGLLCQGFLHLSARKFQNDGARTSDRHTGTGSTKMAAARSARSFIRVYLPTAALITPVICFFTPTLASHPSFRRDTILKLWSVNICKLHDKQPLVTTSESTPH